MAQIMTTREVAKYLKLHEITICKYAAVGKIPAIRIRRVWRFDKEAIDRWIGSAAKQAMADSGSSTAFDYQDISEKLCNFNRMCVCHSGRGFGKAGIPEVSQYVCNEVCGHLDLVISFQWQ